MIAELDALHRDSVWNADEDLVFANPHTGRPMDQSKLPKRFKAACKRASVKPVRFHDLGHTFGTGIAGSGQIPITRFMSGRGHRDYKDDADLR